MWRPVLMLPAKYVHASQRILHAAAVCVHSSQRIFSTVNVRLPSEERTQSPNKFTSLLASTYLAGHTMCVEANIVSNKVTHAFPNASKCI